MGIITNNKGEVVGEFEDTLEDWRQAAKVEAKLRREVQAENVVLTRRLAEAGREKEWLQAPLKSCEAWIDRWTDHVGHCRGGDECTCGRTAILYESRVALTATSPPGPAVG